MPTYDVLVHLEQRNGSNPRKVRQFTKRFTGVWAERESERFMLNIIETGPATFVTREKISEDS